MKITLCLLTFNELECVKVMLPQVPKPGPDAGYDEIVAVDGGSTDGTVDVFKEHGIKVFSQKNKGRGDAFLYAFENIESDAYLFFSPDGNESVEDLPKFRRFLEEGNDVVIASRMMKESFNEEDHLIFKWRKWANNAFNILANVLFRSNGPFITDTINGYRAITKSAANTLELTAADYTIEYQMSIRSFKNKLKIKEFPTYEGERIAGETKAHSIPTGIRFSKRLFKEFVNDPSA